jgi:cationic peptide transport system substrate-binding protein
VLTPDVSKRRQLYFAAQEYVADQVPLIPIAHSRRFQVKSAKVTGMQINPYGGISFTAAGKTP